MAHGERAAKFSNTLREYWSRRYERSMVRGWFSKRLTHRYERQQAKKQLREEV